MKGAQGLGIESSTHQLSLLISNCLVKDVSLPSGKCWTLGNYTAEFGGPQARGKCTFGIFVPFTKRDEENNTDDNCEVASYVASISIDVKFLLNSTRMLGCIYRSVLVIY